MATVDEMDEFGRGNDSERCLSISADFGRLISGVISLKRCLMKLWKVSNGKRVRKRGENFRTGLVECISLD